MFYKKITLILALLIFTLSMCACNNATPTTHTENETSSIEENGENQDDISSTEKNVEDTNNQEDTSETSTDTVEILNFTEPEIGEEIAVIKVKDYGTIKIKLFPDECPKGVENFKRLISEENYYDNVIFHRVIKDFVIQGGDPNGNGTGGESIWGDGFEQELNSGLRHFSGAVAYATASDHLNKSQFYIVCPADCSEISDVQFESFSSYYGASYPTNVIEKYREIGGVPYLDNGYQVFGQVFEGLDIVEAIAENETDNSDKPLEDVVIESATIETYEG